MISLNEIQNASTPAHENDILELVKYVRSQKVFQFNIAEEFPFNIKALIDSAILTESPQHYMLSDEPYLLYQVLIHFKPEFTSQNYESLQGIFEIGEYLQKEFNSAGYKPGSRELRKKIITFLVYSSCKDHELNLTQSLLGNRKDNPHFFDLLEIYTALMPIIPAPPVQLAACLEHLIKEVNDPTVHYNGNIFNIIRGIRNYYESNPTQGEELRLHVLDNPSENLFLVKSRLLASSFEAGLTTPSQYLNILNNCSNQACALNGLANVRFLSDEIAREVLQLTNAFKPCNKENERRVAAIYNTILASDTVGISLKHHCFTQLELILDESFDGNISMFLNHIMYIKNIDNRIVLILLKILAEKEIDANSFQHICSILIQVEDIDAYFEFIEKYALKYPGKFDIEHITSSIHHFRSLSTDKFDQHLVYLLTNNVGILRTVGTKILNHLQLGSSFPFAFDILSLDRITQYKLWVVVLDGYHDPKSTLSLLHPLFKSQFPHVREMFICKVETLSESFSGAALKFMSENLDLKDPDYKSAFERVKLKVDEFHQMIDEKNKILELDPDYTQSRMMRLFREQQTKSMSRKVNKSVTRDSLFLNLGSTIHLMKGGGWKMEGKEEVSELSHIQSSIVIPREFFIEPYMLDYQNLISRKQNWENYFIEWEAIISS